MRGYVRNATAAPQPVAEMSPLSYFEVVMDLRMPYSAKLHDTTSPIHSITPERKETKGDRVL